MSTIVLRFTLALIVLIASPLDSIADGLRAAARPVTLCADVVPPTGIDMVDIMSVASR